MTQYDIGTTDAVPVVAGLRRRFRGTLHLPGDAGYDEHRLGWHRTFESRPALVAAAATAADVRTAVLAAREHDLPLAVQATGGSAPCHLAVSGDGRHLLVANYVSGDVTVFPLDADGVPGERSDLLGLDGKGPVADRQEGPHAHMVAPDPNGSDVLVSDLGSDRVWRTRLDPVPGRLTLVGPAVVAEPGTGPRHLLRTADGALLLVGELTADLTWYRPGAGGELERVGGAVLSASRPNQPSEVTTGRDGRFVYVANRGPDTVSVLAWEPDGGTVVAEVATGGTWPRHIALLADHLYVTNEQSHTVTVFRIDPQTGVPAAQGDPVAENSPTCILQWRPKLARTA